MMKQLILRVWNVLPQSLKDILRKTGVVSLGCTIITVRTRMSIPLLLLTRSWRGMHDSIREYEPAVTYHINQIVKHGWICADVGANVGYITELLAKKVFPSGYVIAFEAHPGNAHALHNLAKFSRYNRIVKVENVAVSDGIVDCLWLYAGRGSSSAEWNIVGHDVEGNKTEALLKVPATSLDTYFQGLRLDFVKMDIEGAEAQALAGMRHILNEIRPIVLVEFHDETGWAGRKELLEAGYELFGIQDKHLEPVRDNRRVYHCLALPQEQVKSFQTKR